MHFPFPQYVHIFLRIKVVSIQHTKSSTSQHLGQSGRWHIFHRTPGDGPQRPNVLGSDDGVPSGSAGPIRSKVAPRMEVGGVVG